MYNEIISSVLSGTYFSMAPGLAAVCTWQGQEVPCGGVASIFGGFFVVWLALALLMVVSAWKIFTKAGQAGWKSIIPIYNVIVLLQIVRRPLWWIVLFFIPFVNIIVGIILAHDVSKAFGKGVGYTLGLIFLPIIFYPMLAFGKSVYQQGPIGQTFAGNSQI